MDDLNIKRLSEKSFEFRHPPKGVVIVDDEFWDGYDSKTIIYECIRDNKSVVIFTPPLLNLTQTFENELNSQVTIKKIQRTSYFNKYTISPNKNEEFIQISLFGEDFKLTFRKCDTKIFENKKVIYTQNKNNNIEWIVSWLKYHASAHGANAALIVDNGSTTYTPKELEKKLIKLSNYEVVKIVSIPLPFMPKQNTKINGPDCNTLQPALTQILSLLYLKKAGGVLNIDIDEFLIKKSKYTIFEELKRSLLGAVLFTGHWVYPDINGPHTHIAHIYRNALDTPHRGKYAYRPNSYFGNGNLGVHNIRGGLRNPVLRNISFTRKFEFLHYRCISTHWASKRNVPESQHYTLDEHALIVSDYLRTI